MLDDLKADVTAALAGTLRTATLWHETPGGDDGAGNQLPGTWTDYACDGVRGNFESVMAGLAGIPRTDARIELLAGTLAIEPEREDKIHIDSTWWKISEIEVDPAGAVFVCQCAETSAVS